MLVASIGRVCSTSFRLAVSLALATASILTEDAHLTPPLTAEAAVYTVNQIADPGDGTCDISCTLRDAILAANHNLGADTIAFSAGGTIVLLSALPSITDTLTIDGNGPGVTVDGSNTFRVLSATAPLTLKALTVQNGYAADDGGGAYFGSTAVISGAIFISNTTGAGGGGAFFNSTAQVTSTTFISNTSKDGGGGATFIGLATLAGTNFISNTTNFSGGGALFTSTATVSSTNFLSNTAGTGGGGARFNGAAVVVSATFISNTAGDIGGGAYFSGTATVSHGSFTSNTAAIGGGAYFSSTATVSDASFISNAATTGGGAFFTGANSVLQASLFQANVAESTGGGLQLMSPANIGLYANRILDNQAADAGGGIYLIDGAGANLENNVLGANTVVSPTGAAEISLAGTGTYLTGRHNTLASATPGSGLALSAGVEKPGQSVFLTNTIFDGYAAGVRAGPFTEAIGLDGVLWSGVTTPTQGTAIMVINAHTGVAAFANPAERNYHLTLPSGARDRAVSTDLSIDFEDDPRPIGPAPDLGADEHREIDPVAPDALDDLANTPEETPITLNVLANDNDLNADPLSVTAVGSPTSGIATISGTAQIVYTPTLNFNGPAVFTYTASDGVLTDMATVTVTVTPVNDAPVAVDDTATTNEDSPTTLSVLSNDNDPDGTLPTIAAVSAPANGTVAISGTTQIVYTPTLNFNGASVFTYTASDGLLTNLATVTVTVTPVNDRPTISDVADLTITVGTATGPIAFTVSDVESVGALTVTASSSNTTLVPNANIVLDGSGTNRTVAIAPAAGQTNQATITLTVSDGTGGITQDSFVLTVIAYRLFLPLVRR